MPVRRAPSIRRNGLPCLAAGATLPVSATFPVGAGAPAESCKGRASGWENKTSLPFVLTASGVAAPDMPDAPEM